MAQLKATMIASFTGADENQLTVKRGTEVICKYKDTNWSYCSYQGKQGYVPTAYLSFGETNDDELDYGSYSYYSEESFSESSDAVSPKKDSSSVSKKLSSKQISERSSHSSSVSSPRESSRSNSIHVPIPKIAVSEDAKDVKNSLSSLQKDTITEPHKDHLHNGQNPWGVSLRAVAEEGEAFSSLPKQDVPTQQTPNLQTPLPPPVSRKQASMLENRTEDEGVRTQIQSQDHLLMVLSNKTGIYGLKDEMMRESANGKNDLMIELIEEYHKKEIEYYSALSDVYNNYLMSIHYNNNPLIHCITDTSQMGCLLQSMRQILDIHNNILYHYEQRKARTQQWTNEGQTEFLTLFSLSLSFLSPYVYYSSVLTICSNYLETKQNIPEFKCLTDTYIRLFYENNPSMSTSANYHPVFDVLSTPIKKIVYYMQLLTRMESIVTQKSDKERIHDCILQIDGLISSMNASLEEEDSRIRLSEINERITTTNPSGVYEGLLCRHRILHLEDCVDCRCSNRSKDGEYTVLLCNDTVFFTKYLNDKYTIKFIYKTEHMQYNDCERLADKAATYSKEDLSFTLLLDCDVWTITASTYSKKRIWIQFLAVILSSNKPSVANAEETAPFLDDTCAHTFSSHSLNASIYTPKDLTDSHFVSIKEYKKTKEVVSYNTQKNENERVCANCESRLGYNSHKQCSLCKRIFCKSCCNTSVLFTDSMSFERLCNDCFIRYNINCSLVPALDVDCYSSHQSLLQNILNVEHYYSLARKEKESDVHEIMPEIPQVIIESFIGQQMEKYGVFVRCGLFGVMNGSELLAKTLLVCLFEKTLLIGSMSYQRLKSENKLFKLEQSFLLNEVGVVSNETANIIHILFNPSFAWDSVTNTADHGFGTNPSLLF